MAQTVSQEGRFSVEISSGCAPLTVNIESLDDFGNITRQYIYENGLAATSDTTYTYLQPGIYSLVQIVGVDVSPKTDTLVIEVFDSRDPEFQIFKCEDNQVELIITDNYYSDYVVDFDANNQMVVSSNDDPVVHTYGSTGIQNITVQGSFSAGATNCAAVTQSVDIVPFTNNGRVTDVQLTRSCLSSLNATVYFTVDPQQYYQVQFRAGTGSYLTVFEGEITTDSLYFPEFTFSTDRRICFRVNALSACSFEVAQGQDFCVTNPNSIAPEISNAYATFSNGDVLLSFDEVAIGGFFGDKRALGFDFERLDTLYPGYIDRNVSNFREYEYRIGFADVCGNVIPPVSLLTSFVSGEETRANHYSFTWKPPTTQLTGNTLNSLIVVGENGQEQVFNNPDNPTEIFLEEPFGRTQYVYLRTIYDTGVVIESNRVPLTYEYYAYIPDGFTPNGDFLNDELRIIGLSNDAIDWKIYNRWGEVIFQSSSAEIGWDGTYRGNRAPEGVYFYDLTFLNSLNETIRQRGSFVLIRN